MIFKMKYLFFNFITALFLSKGCIACFQEDWDEDFRIPTGGSFYRECQCTEPGYTVDTLQWLDTNGMPLGTDPNIYTELRDNALVLIIRRISKSIAGTYKCVTNYNGVTHSQAYKISAYDLLDFIDTPTKQYLAEGKESTISCNVVGDYDLVVWHKGDIEITTENFPSGKYEKIDNGLIVKEVTKDDADTYRCSAFITSAGIEVDRYIKVEVMTTPVIKELFATPEATVSVGERLTVKCVAEGLPNPEYFWNRTSEPTNHENRNATWIQTDNIIVFNRIGALDRGTYECYATNDVGVVKKEIAIDVLVGPEIVNFINITVLEDTEILMLCNVTGNPTPNVTIVYRGKNVADIATSDYVDPIPNYSIIQVNRSHEGIYLCNASNIVDYETEIMYLEVHHRPNFKENKQLVWGWNGSTVNLSCAHESSPPANLTWSFYNNDYDNLDMTFTDEVMMSKMLNKEDSIMEQSFLITDNFSPYGVYNCKAINKYGEDTKEIELRKGYSPSPVENASTSELTATTATFSIGTPFQFDGPDVLGFTAEYDEADNYAITDIHQNRTWSMDWPFKLNKLKPNTTYYIRFAAINAVGTGQWSQMIEFVTLEKSPPEPPVWPEHPLQVTSTNHLLMWKTPDDNGDPIDYYILRYCPKYDQFDEKLCKVTSIVPTTDRPAELELSNLELNTTYYLELVAHNSQGNSTAANVTILVPAEALEAPYTVLSAGVIIGISVIVVLLCLLMLDLILLFWRKQGLIAMCCYKKNKKKTTNLNSRDKKGLLKNNSETTADDTLRRPNNNGHKEYEYNKTTGIITGKHSAV